MKNKKLFGLRKGHIDINLSPFGYLPRRVKFLYGISIDYITYGTRLIRLHVTLPLTCGNSAHGFFDMLVSTKYIIHVSKSVTNQLPVYLRDNTRLTNKKLMGELYYQIRRTEDFREWVMEKTETEMVPDRISFQDSVQVFQKAQASMQSVAKSVCQASEGFASIGTALQSLDEFREKVHDELTVKTDGHKISETISELISDTGYENADKALKRAKFKVTAHWVPKFNKTNSK